MTSIVAKNQIKCKKVCDAVPFDAITDFGEAQSKTAALACKWVLLRDIVCSFVKRTRCRVVEGFRLEINSIISVAMC